MRLSHIALRNMRRHWTRTLMLAVLIASVVAVVGSLYFVNRSADDDLAGKVDEYGANITVVPRSQELPLTYGGVRLGSLTYDARPLSMDQVALIRTIREQREHQPGGAQASPARAWFRASRLWRPGFSGTRSWG